MIIFNLKSKNISGGKISSAYAVFKLAYSLLHPHVDVSLATISDVILLLDMTYRPIRHITALAVVELRRLLLVCYSRERTQKLVQWWRCSSWKGRQNRPWVLTLSREEWNTCWINTRVELMRSRGRSTANKQAASAQGLKENNNLTRPERAATWIIKT